MERRQSFQLLLKRAFDVLWALLLLVPAALLLALGGLLVKLCSPGAPVLFKQLRVGFRRRPFIIYKLRSMTDERGADGRPLPSEQRLKWWGKVLRGSNIDELPQILNILKGEMSWIGPRPLLPEEMAVMTESEQEERQAMRPGIAGWEAVNEGKSSSRREMAMFDLEYVRNWSVWFDVKIFLKTVAIVFLKLRPGEEGRAPKLDEREFVSQRQGK